MSHQSKKTALLGNLMVLLLILSVVVCLFPATALAAGNDVVLSGSILKDCVKGDTVSVFFEIPAEVYVCDFTALISYDAELLEPVKTENSNGELVWVDTDVFAAGLASNVVEDGIRVAGATAQAGYKKGGKLLKINFKVLESIPEAGTEVKVGFSVFHVAKTADATEDQIVSVTPAKLTPGEKKQENTSNNQGGNNGSTNTGKPSDTPDATNAATEPTTEPATEATTVPTTTPATEQPTTEATAPSQGNETTVPTQPTGGKDDPAAKPPIGLILAGCGAVAVVLGIVLFILLKKRKQNDA